MAEEFRIIWLLAIGLGLACVLGYVAQWLKLPPILGYLLAGYLIGPHSPGFVADISMAEQLATIGVTLLMFTVGLNFRWEELGAVKHLALPGVIILSLLSLLAGIFYSMYLGESFISGFVIGLAICGSSTVVIVRVLTDQGLLHTRQGQVVMGWTIVDDLISVFGLILLPALVAQSMTTHDQLLFDIGYPLFLVAMKMLVLWVFLYFIGETLIHKMLRLISRTRSHELFTLAILTCVFLIAIGSSHLFGVSLALGAFIAGTIVGKTDLGHQAAANALPMRDSFSVIFFLSVGMLFNPSAVTNNPRLFLGLLFLLLVVRPLLAFLFIIMARYPIAVALTVGLAIAEIGEYSFILAEEGSRLGILPSNVYDILVACSFLTIGLNPLLFQIFRPICHTHLSSRSGASSENEFFEEESIPELTGKSRTSRELLPRAIVVGFGPIGQKAYTYLLKKGYQVLVIDRNIDTISSLKRRKVETIFGDATQFHILEKAHIDNTRLLVITTPDFSITQAIIRTARHVNPFVPIVARSHFQEETQDHIAPDVITICDEEATAEKFLSTLHTYLQEKV